MAGLIWGLLTFWFQKVVTWAGSNLRYVVFTRIMFGAAQGVHFPALASISSKNLNSKDRGFFFSATTAGGAIGTLVTGTIGSYMNETFGWSTVFYSIGKQKTNCSFHLHINISVDIVLGTIPMSRQQRDLLLMFITIYANVGWVDQKKSKNVLTYCIV